MLSPRFRGFFRSTRLRASVLARFCYVHVRYRRAALPELVARLSEPPRRPAPRRSTQRLSWTVYRTLQLAGHRPTCLASALVLFRMLRAQGDEAELVIGLPSTPSSKDAHAWVELSGRDVGPPPGRSGHLEFARYPTAGMSTLLRSGEPT